MNKRVNAILGKLKSCGFFQCYSQESDEELGMFLEQAFRAKIGFSDFEKYVENLDEVSLELRLASLDSTKVWNRDIECDVCQEHKVYEEVVREFGLLSDGIFKPSEIKEEWSSSLGPIKVTFIDNGERFSFSPNYDDDWLDVGIIVFLQELLEKRGFINKFYPYTGHGENKWGLGQELYLIKATIEEKELLKKFLDWNLEY